MQLEMIGADRKKLSHYLIGNARILIMVLILFTVVVVTTTDVRLVTIASITDLGLEFFVLLFCSYGMYVSCADSGIKSGYETDTYKDAVVKYEELRERVEDAFMPRLNDFCVHYIEEELRRTRMQYLSVACITYDEYMHKYVTFGKKELEQCTELTGLQRKALLKANSVRRIKLTPDMLMSRGKMLHARSGLIFTPDAVKNIAYSVKIVKMAVISLCMSLIALDIILEPSWTVFAEACLKLATVVINGFDGHKEGFNNITVYTVNYVNNQTVLLRQAIQYIEAHPTND